MRLLFEFENGWMAHRYREFIPTHAVLWYNAHEKRGKVGGGSAPVKYQTVYSIILC